MSEQIAVRVPSDLLDELDRLVDDGVYGSRAEAVRTGIVAVVELPLGPDDGMPTECAASFDNLRVVPKTY